jgi:hypothetical protein
MWLLVACVFGMDYLSGLAYLPSVAYTAAGTFSPFALIPVVLVTFIFTLPIYLYTAGRSSNGSGTLGLLEKILPGWSGKLFVVVMLGFAATDMVFTRTFSTADAAEHIIHSPLLQGPIDGLATATNSVEKELPDSISSMTKQSNKRQLVVAVGLLLAGSLFGWYFRKGVDRRLVIFAVVIVVSYLSLTLIIVIYGFKYLLTNPDLIHNWWANIRNNATIAHRPSYWGMAIACVALFPQVALGLSGFELSLTAVPIIRTRSNDQKSVIRRTRIMLISLAVIMCTLMIASTFITALLIPAEALANEGNAQNRALAYIAHGSELIDKIEPTNICPFFGPVFGTTYDFATIIVLTISGVVVLIGTRELIPPYLHRLGMEWSWSNRIGLMMYIFTAIKIIVTAYYKADVEAQRGAYLTGVLALFAGGAITATIDLWQRREGKKWIWRLSPLFVSASLIFTISLIVVVVRQPVAIRMAGAFVLFVILSSMITRFFRTRELRFEGFEYANEESRLMFWHLQNNDYPMLLPYRPGQDQMADKEKEIRESHRLPVGQSVVFIVAQLADPSNFYQRPVINIVEDDSRVVVEISQCTSVPHAIAAVALEIAKAGPLPEVHFGWSQENPLTANINFVLFGQGNIPWMVRELIRTAKVPDDRRPKVIVG